MSSATLVNLKGKSVGELKLDDAVFGIEPNTAVLFEALQRQLSNARAGSANTKTRSEVAGGGRKPWRQKGTGRARAGSIRSPLWSGGGVIFGPKPRDYSVSMPKKMRRLALKSALAASKGKLVVIKDLEDFKEAKTKQMSAVLANVGLAGKKVLLVMDFACPTCELVRRAARNIEFVRVVHVNELNVKDLLDAEAVLTTERTIEAINSRFAAEASTGVAKSRAATRPGKEAGAEPEAKTAAKPKAAAKAKTEPAKEGKAKAKAGKKTAEAGAEGEAKPARKKAKTEE